MGNGALILPGVSIGTKNMDPGKTYAGNPEKEIRDRKELDKTIDTVIGGKSTGKVDREYEMNNGKIIIFPSLK